MIKMFILRHVKLNVLKFGLHIRVTEVTIRSFFCQLHRLVCNRTRLQFKFQKEGYRN